MSDYPFIVIEGIDGTGKTSVARELAIMIDGKYLSTPVPPFDALPLLSRSAAAGVATD